MSDIDSGYDGGGDVDYGHYQAGQEHGELDQLHQASGSEADYNNQFAVYEQDHAAAESTSFDQGHHVEYDNRTARTTRSRTSPATTTTRPRPTTSSPPKAAS